MIVAEPTAAGTHPTHPAADGGRRRVAQPDLTRIGVVGAGLMGSGIAEVCALAALDVVVVEASPLGAEHASQRVGRSLARGVSAGRLGERDRTDALARLRFVADLESLRDRDLVVEAVAENDQAKLSIFNRLDAIVERRDAVLASNTSSIPIMKLAMATSRPENVIGVHFFNPVPVLRLVELVPSLLTAESVRARAEGFVTEVLDKRPILCQDRAGFVVNALLVPYLLSAIRMLESGFASARDIDTGMVDGCAHPMGPLRLADLIGLDTVKAIAESMYLEFRDAAYSPPPLLSRMVEAGLLGRKSGRGFHDYSR